MHICLLHLWASIRNPFPSIWPLTHQESAYSISAPTLSIWCHFSFFRCFIIKIPFLFQTQWFWNNYNHLKTAIVGKRSFYSPNQRSEKFLESPKPDCIKCPCLSMLHRVLKPSWQHLLWYKAQFAPTVGNMLHNTAYFPDATVRGFMSDTLS